MKQLKVQRKCERDGGLCRHCDANCADWSEHLVLHCSKFAEEREAMLCDVVGKLALSRMHWDRTAAEDQLYMIMYSFMDRWAKGKLKEAERTTLKQKRREIIYAFLRFLKKTGRFEEW